MKNLRVIIGLAGIILFIVGATLKVMAYIDYRKNTRSTLRNISAYNKINPDKKVITIIARYTALLGLVLMVIANNYIKD
jgi:hypothetical protein